MSAETPGHGPTPPPAPPYTGGPDPVVVQRSNLLSIIAFVCAAVSLLILPIVFGPIAIILSAVAISRKEPLGKIALGVSIAAMIAGFVIGALVFTAAST